MIKENFIGHKMVYIGTRIRKHLVLVLFNLANRKGDEIMCDWNNNGKYDMEDAFISYHIHRSISGNKQNQDSSGDAGDVVTVIGIVLLVFGILLIFV